MFFIAFVFSLACSLSSIRAASSSGPQLTPGELTKKAQQAVMQQINNALPYSGTDASSALLIAKILVECGEFPTAKRYVAIAELQSNDDLSVQKECNLWTTLIEIAQNNYTDFSAQSAFNTDRKKLAQLAQESNPDIKRAANKTLALLYEQQAKHPDTSITLTRTLENLIANFKTKADSVSNAFKLNTPDGIELSPEILKKLHANADSIMATYLTATETNELEDPVWATSPFSGAAEQLPTQSLAPVSYVEQPKQEVQSLPSATQAPDQSNSKTTTVQEQTHKSPSSSIRFTTPVYDKFTMLDPDSDEMRDIINAKKINWSEEKIIKHLLHLLLTPNYAQVLDGLVDYAPKEAKSNVHPLTALDAADISPELAKLACRVFTRGADIALHARSDDPEIQNNLISIAKELAAHALVHNASVDDIPEYLTALVDTLPLIPSSANYLDELLQENPDLAQALADKAPHARYHIANKVQIHSDHINLHLAARQYVHALLFHTPLPKLTLEEARAIMQSFEDIGQSELANTFIQNTWRMLPAGKERGEPALFLWNKVLATKDQKRILKVCKQAVSGQVSELYDEICLYIASCKDTAPEDFADIIAPMAAQGNEYAQFIFADIHAMNDDAQALRAQYLENLSHSQNEYLRFEAQIQQAYNAPNDLGMWNNFLTLFKNNPSLKTKISTRCLPILFNLLEATTDLSSIALLKQEIETNIKNMNGTRDPLVKIRQKLFELKLQQINLMLSLSKNKKPVFDRLIANIDSLQKDLCRLKVQAPSDPFEAAVLEKCKADLEIYIDTIASSIAASAGREEASIEYITKAFRKHPHLNTTKSNVYALVENLLKKKKYAKVKETLMGYAKVHPQCTYISKLCLKIAMDHRDLDFCKIIGDKPYVDEYNANALVCAALLATTLDEQEIYLRKAVNLVPDYMHAVYNLGLLYNLKSRYEEALPLFESIAYCNPYAAYEAACLYLAGIPSFDPKRAAELFSRALELPTDPLEQQKYEALKLCSIAHMTQFKDLDALVAMYHKLYALQENTNLHKDTLQAIAIALKSLDNQLATMDSSCNPGVIAALKTLSTQRLIEILQEKINPHAIYLIAQSLLQVIEEDSQKELKPYGEYNSIQQKTACRLLNLCKKAVEEAPDEFSKKLYALRKKLEDSVFGSIEPTTLESLLTYDRSQAANSTKAPDLTVKDLQRMLETDLTVEDLQRMLETNLYDAAKLITELKVRELYTAVFIKKDALYNQNPQQFIEILSEMANDGRHDVQLYLGSCFFQGALFDQDMPRGRQLLELAAQSPLEAIKIEAEIKLAHHTNMLTHYANLKKLLEQYNDCPPEITARLHYACANVCARIVQTNPTDRETHNQNAFYHMQEAKKAGHSLTDAAIESLNITLATENTRVKKHNGQLSSAPRKQCKEWIADLKKGITRLQAEKDLVTQHDPLSRLFHHQQADELILQKKIAIAAILALQGDMTRSIAICIRTFQEHGPAVEVKLFIDQLHQILIEKEKPDVAKEMLDQLIAINPNMPFLYRLQAHTARLANDPAAELEYSKKAGSLGDHTTAYFAYLKSDKPEDRITCLRLALKGAPNDRTYCYRLENELLCLKRFQDVEQLLLERAQSGEASAYIRLAQLHQSGNLARESNKKAVREYLEKARTALPATDEGQPTLSVTPNTHVGIESLKVTFPQQEHRNWITALSFFTLLRDGTIKTEASFTQVETALKQLTSEKWDGLKLAYVVSADLYSERALQFPDNTKVPSWRMIAHVFACKAMGLGNLEPVHLRTILKIAQQQTPPMPYDQLAPPAQNQWTQIKKLVEGESKRPSYNPDNSHTQAINRSWPEIKAQIWGEPQLRLQ